MHKNWGVICEIENPWLRMLVATTDEPQILEGLQKGFPNLFSEDGVKLCIPLSAIRQRMSEEEYRLWSGPLKHLLIPNFEWGIGSVESISSEVPHEWREVIAQLQPNTDDAYDFLYETGNPTYLYWMGHKCLLVELFGYEHDGEVQGLTLVPAEFIDLDK